MIALTSKEIMEKRAEIGRCRKIATEISDPTTISNLLDRAVMLEKEIERNDGIAVYD